MKKTLLAINIFFLVFIMPLNVMNDQKQSYAALEIKQYFENVNISVEIFEEQISLYTHITKTEYGEEILYDDVYSGAFIDDDGILNICLVNGSEASALMDERIRFTSQEFSLNYLMEIYDNLISIMEDYSISEVNIDERENKVNIMYYDTRKQTEINEYLFSEKLYNNDAVNL